MSLPISSEAAASDAAYTATQYPAPDPQVKASLALVMFEMSLLRISGDVSRVPRSTLERFIRNWNAQLEEAYQKL